LRRSGTPEVEAGGIRKAFRIAGRSSRYRDGSRALAKVLAAPPARFSDCSFQLHVK